MTKQTNKKQRLFFPDPSEDHFGNFFLRLESVLHDFLADRFYLPKMLEFTKWVNSNFLKGFTVPQVTKNHGWHESLVWSQALVNADDFDRFKALQWKIRPWDVWNSPDCDHRFGDEWPGRDALKLIAATTRICAMK